MPFAWNQSIKRCHLFNSCVVVATVHLHCFLRTVVKKKHQCLNCSSSMNEWHKTYVSMACWRYLFWFLSLVNLILPWESLSTAEGIRGVSNLVESIWGFGDPKECLQGVGNSTEIRQGVDNFAACQQGFSGSTAGGRGAGHPAVGGEVSASPHQYSIGHPLQQVGKVLILSGHQQPCIMQERGQRSYSERKRCQRPETLLWAISSTSQRMVYVTWQCTSITSTLLSMETSVTSTLQCYPSSWWYWTIQAFCRIQLHLWLW